MLQRYNENGAFAKTFSQHPDSHSETHTQGDVYGAGD